MVGREMFKSYEQKVAINFVDWLLNGVGSILTFFGLVLYFFC